MQHISFLIPTTLLILFCVGSHPTLFAQKGFKVIHKAERKYEKGKPNKALRLLDKAQGLDYFCGLGYMSAYDAIIRLRVQILFDRQAYQQARVAIESRNGAMRGLLDSLYVRSYQLEYGEDSLQAWVDPSLTGMHVEEVESNVYVVLPLKNGGRLKLWMGSFYKMMQETEVEEERILAYWLRNFGQGGNYELLTGHPYSSIANSP